MSQRPTNQIREQDKTQQSWGRGARAEKRERQLEAV